VFEVLGSPVGLDFVAERADGMSARPGEVLDAAGEPTAVRLRSPAPRLRLGDETFDPPIRQRLIRITAEGVTLVAEVDGPLDVAAPGPGRYRLEVEVTPTHLAPWTVGREALLRPALWLYGNPLEVR
jgi:hypothetical protein